jgi:adenosine deaminase
MFNLRVHAVFVFLVSITCAAQGPNEKRTASYLDSIRQQPALLVGFLREMPKGSDLHTHLVGAIYAERFIDYAAEDGKCIDRTTLTVQPQCPTATGQASACATTNSKPQVSCAYQDQDLYNAIVDAWSMRNWNSAKDSGHDHFFGSFLKFDNAFHGHMADLMAEVERSAAANHVQYLEVMHTMDGSQAQDLARRVGWDDDFGALRQKLLAQGLNKIAENSRTTLSSDETRAREILQCGTPQADPGCSVTVRYLYQVLRGFSRENVFAQILLGFELAQADSRVVGLNLVMPEDWYTPMHDFDLHMKMLDYLHGIYPNVHITLHAGELAPGLVPPDGLRSHVRQSIETGHAERIGHGVTVAYEDNPQQLLEEMAKREILVEICLTSNDVILGIKGNEHPLSIYRKNGVPVALSTDDQGVSRSDMTKEYMRAVMTQNLSYTDLKDMARQGLEHSFLPGASLWSNIKDARKVSNCSDDPSQPISTACSKFLAASPRAQEQWKLEQSFNKFESRY